MHDEGFFSAKDNLRLFWESEVPDAAPPKAHVIVAHGYGDHAGRLKGVIGALAEAGFAVHAFDFRGHGKSDGRRGYCDRFEGFVDDLDLFIQKVRRQLQAAGTPDAKVFLLAHSHGALTAVHWLKRTGGAGISGVVMSAPWLKLAFEPPLYKVVAARALQRVVPWLPIPAGVDIAWLSRDPELQRNTANDPLYGKTATPRWFVQATAAQAQALTYGADIQVPLFLFFGGDDKVASSAAARQLFDTIASPDKRLKEYPGMRHEPLNELGKEEVFTDVVGWISSHL